MDTSEQTRIGENRSSEFLSTFSKVRTVARHSLVGPRSVVYPKCPSGLERWVEPILILRKRKQSPLLVETSSIMRQPNCIDDLDSSKLLIRTARWDGERDRQACKKSTSALPSLLVDYYAVDSMSIPVLDATLRTTDATLQCLPFHIEGLTDGYKEPSVAPCSQEDRAITTSAFILGIWRRTRYQELDFSWHESDSFCIQVSRAFNELFRLLEEIKETSRSIPTDQYLEKYELGSNPESLWKWLKEREDVGQETK